MEAPSVLTFTDTYLPTVNGVTYAIEAWQRHYQQLGGRFDIVCPASPQREHEPDNEYTVPSASYGPYKVNFGKPGAIPDAVYGASYDIVHSHSPYFLGVAAFFFAQRHNLPHVSTYHTPFSLYVDKYAIDLPGVTEAAQAFVRSIERNFLMHMTDAITVPSRQTRDYLLSNVDVEAGRITVLSNGVDIEHFHPVNNPAFRRKYDLDPERPLFGHVGRLGPEKNIEDIIGVARKRPDAQFVIGGIGPEEEGVKERVRDLGLSDRFRFIGFVERDELPDFYSALDVFIHPSTVETEGLVALESMACLTPVVAARAMALKETVRDDKTGLLYEPGNIDDLAHKLDEAHQRQDLVRSCSDQRDRISVRHSVEQLIELYQQLV